MLIYIPYNSHAEFFSTVFDVRKDFGVLTAEEADKKGMCKNCKYDSKSHPHYLIEEELKYHEAYGKLCIVSYIKKFRKLNMEDL